MREDQREVLERVALQGTVHPDAFTGRGMVVAMLVRRGYLEWERAKAPRYMTPTALVITEAGRAALSSPDRTTNTEQERQ